MVRSKYLFFLVVVALATTWFAYDEYQHSADGALHVWFFDVGQGDGALVVTPSGKQIVIDGGPDLSLLEHVGDAMPFLDRSIDVVVLSHPHLDHIMALPELLRRYDVGAVVLSPVSYGQPVYDHLLTLMHEQDVMFIEADPHRDIRFADGTVLDIVWPPPGLLGADVEDVNGASVALRIISGEHRVFFTGDMGIPEEEALLRSGQDLRADVLKVGHHGSRYSSGTGFLIAVDPQTAIISAGPDNRYSHPHPEALHRLDNLGIEIRNTMDDGTVHMWFE